jgi:hypothetical protein
MERRLCRPSRAVRQVSSLICHSSYSSRHASRASSLRCSAERPSDRNRAFAKAIS